MKNRADLLPKTIETAEAHVLEEIGEVLQAYGKRDRFGITARDPKTGIEYNNQADFETELRDLQDAVVNYFRLKGIACQ